MTEQSKRRKALWAEASLAQLLADGALDMWPDDKRKIEAALETIRKFAQSTGQQ